MVARKAARKAARQINVGQTTFTRETRPIAYLVRSDGSLVTEMRPPTHDDLYSADLVIVVEPEVGFVVLKDRYGARDRGPVTAAEALARVEYTMQLHREPF